MRLELLLIVVILFSGCSREAWRRGAIGFVSPVPQTQSSTQNKYSYMPAETCTTKQDSYTGTVTTKCGPNPFGYQ